MTWLSQVGHVARKDVRQFWWLVIVYIALVGVVTATAGADEPPASLIVALDGFIVVAFGMAMAATLVQSDSPSRSNAFWITRPLAPSAVFAAKLVLSALGVIGIGVAGEIIGLEALGLQGHLIGPLVLRSIALYSTWLLAAITIAALTPDFRSFVITILVTVFAFLLLAQTFFEAGLHLSTTVSAAGALLALGAVSYRYGRRDMTRAIWGLAGVGVFASLTVVVASPDRTLADSQDPRDSAQISLSGSAAVARRDALSLDLRVANGDSLHAYTFICDTLIVHLSDGSTKSLVPRWGVINLQTASLPRLGVVRWHSPGSRAVSKVAYALDDDEQIALARGVSSVELAGRVNSYAPDFTAALPLRPGQQAVRDGTRFRISKIEYPPDSMSVELMTVSVTGPKSAPLPLLDLQDPFMWADAPRFVLVNRRLAEGLLLQSKSNSVSNGWVVLPGAPLEQRTTRLVPIRHLDQLDTIPSNRSWYSDAELYLFRWRARGTYRVHARLAVP